MFIRHVHLYTKCGEIVYTILCIHDNFSNLFAYIERNPFRSWHCIEHWRNNWILSICPKNKTLKRETFNLQNNISIWVTLPTLREFWARAKLKRNRNGWNSKLHVLYDRHNQLLFDVLNPRWMHALVTEHVTAQRWVWCLDVLKCWPDRFLLTYIWK